MSNYNYYDDWRTTQFVCPACKWTGLGSALAQGETFSELYELNCPACHGDMAIISYPTIEESRANWGKLPDGERKHIEFIEQFRADFQRRKLRNPEQLPPIELEAFVLDWDFDGPDRKEETQIKLGLRVIFSEPAVWEGYERFIEVAGILRARYGAAIRDLIPTSRSENYLYGDKLSSPETVNQARNRIFNRNQAPVETMVSASSSPPSDPKPEMLPDLGLHYTSLGYPQEMRHCFYSVQFSDIAVLDTNAFTSTFEYLFTGKAYAMSFDFDARIFQAVINKLPQKEKEQYLASLVGKQPPYYSDLPSPVIAKSITARLGEPQKGRNDTFIPFVIDTLE